MVSARRTRFLLPIALTVALTAAGAIPAAATGATARPGAQTLNDPVFPTLGNGGYDALRYDLAFTYLADTRLVDAVSTMTARATQTLSEFSLDSVGAQIHQVTVNGRHVEFSQEGEKLVVTPGRNLHQGRVFVVKVTYTADPRMTGHSGWVYTADGFATAGQPDSAHSIFPSNDHPSDKARFTIQVDVPSALLGVANGTRTASTTADGRTRSTYVSRNPMATELVQVAVGDYTEVHRTGPDGLPLRDVVPTGRQATLEPALALTPGQLTWLEARLGTFPFETYGLLPVSEDNPPNLTFTGLETQTLTLYRPSFLEQPESAIGSHMMHELTHSWFGNSVSPGTWADVWINEGHADYYGLLYRYEKGWTDSRGYTNLTDRMKYTYSQGDLWRASSGPVAAPNAANLWDNQRYTGGVLALFALREQIGAEAFDTLEHTLLARYQDRSVTTADFIDVASEVSGQDLHDFLGDWLYGTKTPPMPNHPDWTVVAPTAALRSTVADSSRDNTGTL
jgi:aminopeptidase N